MDVWEAIGNQCLTYALALLKDEEKSVTETIDTVQKLVSTAIAIDTLNLQWATRSQSFSPVFPGQPFLRPAKEN